jgi:putative DNA primase/helicase
VGVNEACELLFHGLAAVPVCPRTKRPTVRWAEFQARPPSASEAAAWDFSGGVGYVCGEASGGVEVIDFDVPDKPASSVPPAWEPWLGIVREHAPGLAERLAIVRTPSGGRHAVYRCPAPGRNRKLACLEDGRVLAETRGQGGFVVCPPTPGYEWVQGGPDSIPDLTEEERGLLIRAAELLDRSERPDPGEAEARRSLNGQARPGDEFAERASWEEILEPHGWRKVGRWVNQTLWRRPGKSEGWSAKTGMGTAGDRMYVWSTNAGLPAGRALTKFAVLAHLDHGGDYAACARALAARGFGAAPAPRRAEPGEDAPEWPDPTDVGNAAMFVAMHAGRALYVPEWRRWTVYDRGVWAPDDGAAACQLAMRVAEERRAMAEAMAERATDDASRKEAARALRFAEACRNRARIEAMVHLASTFPEMRTSADEMDRSELELCVENGVVDLRTGRLRPHSPDDRFTRRCPHPYDPDARAPVFERFVRQMAREREHLARALLLYLGYSLTGTVREQVWLLLWGPRGRNGKTTLHNVMQRVLGPDLAGPIDKRLLRSSTADAARFALSAVEGKRLVMANETASKARLDTEFIKEFVGDQHVFLVERKGVDSYQARLRAKLIYSVNNLPAADFDNSFRSRTVVFPCDQSFYERGAPEWQPGDLPPDPDLDAKLEAESPAILSELVRWCVRWHEGGLEIPQESRDAVAEYEAENDHIGEWLSECCVLEPEARETVGNLHKAYLAWAKEKGAPQCRPNEFRARLDREPSVRVVKPKNVRTALGIRLASGQMSLGESGQQ